VFALDAATFVLPMLLVPEIRRLGRADADPAEPAARLA
jgi:hypothetical protein